MWNSKYGDTSKRNDNTKKDSTRTDNKRKKEILSESAALAERKKFSQNLLLYVLHVLQTPTIPQDRPVLVRISPSGPSRPHEMCSGVHGEEY